MRGELSNSLPYERFSERAESTTTNIAASAQIKPSVDSGIPIGGATQRPGGINLGKESESKQESDQQEGDHSAAIDHSGRNSGRRIGSLRGPRHLTPPLALAAKETQNTSRLCRNMTWPAKQNYASLFGCQEARILIKGGLRRGGWIHTWLGTLSLRLFGALV
jgi:hypothetical protein